MSAPTSPPVAGELTILEEEIANRVADTHPDAAQPVKAPPPRQPVPARRRRIGAWITGFGLLLCGFLAFSLLITDVIQDRAQTLLRPCLKERMGAEAALLGTQSAASAQEGSSLDAFADTAPTGGESAADTADGERFGCLNDTLAGSVNEPKLGQPLALIRIPKLGVEQVVVEGTSQKQLADGPGHYRGSALPGQLGNIVIAGRRATYGAPFERIGELTKGDVISVDTGLGRYDYRVAEVGLIKPGENDVISEDGTNRLTLVTANSPYKASGRLAVIARLPRSDGSTAAPLLDRTNLELPNAELGLDRDTTAWAPVVIWGQLLILAWFLRRRLASWWSPAASWMVMVPISLAFGLLWFESLSRLLPSTL